VRLAGGHALAGREDTRVCGVGGRMVGGVFLLVLTMPATASIGGMQALTRGLTSIRSALVSRSRSRSRSPAVCLSVSLSPLLSPNPRPGPLPRLRSGDGSTIVIDTCAGGGPACE